MMRQNRAFVGFFLLLGVLSAFFGISAFISAMVAYICSLLTAFVSYKSYERQIFIKADEYVGDENENSKRLAKKNRLMFFAPLKLLAYALLFLSLVVLQKISLLNLIFFGIGVFFMPISIVFHLKFSAKL